MAQGSNAQKVPLARAIKQSQQRTIADILQLTGKNLPCSVVSLDGWIVTVKFEIDDPTFTLPQITIPVFSSNYDYLPLQEGDKGLCMSAATYLGGISGLGGGTAGLILLPNLTTLGFVPTGNKEWTGPDDPLVRVIQGPNGVIIQTLDGETTIVEVLKDTIKMTRGDTTSVEMTADEITVKKGDDSKISMTDDEVKMSFGDDNYVLVDTDGVHIKGTLEINDKDYLAHEHSGVQVGGANSGGVHNP